MLSPDEKTSVEVIGRVETKFVSYQPIHIVSEGAIKKKAYSKLMAEAQKKYQGNIEIVNISADGAFNALTLIPLPCYFGVLGTFQTVWASGDVIRYSDGNRRTTTTGIEGALARAAEEVSENFTARSRIAIVYITAEDRSQTDFIAGELEHILRRQGFVIIDRSELDRIRAEQRFGTSGEVDDNTAARIGNIAGASVVITGRVDGDGNLRRLRLRALNTDNGQVVGTASERL
jgi:hypothetical protein